jgi:site-specific recombinase XerD
MPPQVLQALLGHADLRVTSVYVQAEARDLVRGMRALRAGQAAGR